MKPLGRVEIIPSPYVTESTRIALLLPTFEHQVKETLDFISHYEKTCMEHQDNTFLLMVYIMEISYLLQNLIYFTYYRFFYIKPIRQAKVKMIFSLI